MELLTKLQERGFTVLAHREGGVVVSLLILPPGGEEKIWGWFFVGERTGNVPHFLVTADDVRAAVLEGSVSHFLEKDRVFDISAECILEARPSLKPLLEEMGYVNSYFN